MSEYSDWQADQAFMHNEFVSLFTRSPGVLERFVMGRVLWLNQEGFRSERVSMDVPMLSPDHVHVVERNIVVGWHCGTCETTYFAADLKGLRHEPCCGDI